MICSAEGGAGGVNGVRARLQAASCIIDVAQVWKKVEIEGRVGAREFLSRINGLKSEAAFCLSFIDSHGGADGRSLKAGGWLEGGGGRERHLSG